MGRDYSLSIQRLKNGGWATMNIFTYSEPKHFDDYFHAYYNRMMDNGNSAPREFIISYETIKDEYIKFMKEKNTSELRKVSKRLNSIRSTTDITRNNLQQLRDEIDDLLKCEGFKSFPDLAMCYNLCESGISRFDDMRVVYNILS